MPEEAKMFTQPWERPSARTPEEREAHFQNWLVHARFKTPWFESVDELRERFMRRYTRPDPPEGMEPIRSLAAIQVTE